MYFFKIFLISLLTGSTLLIAENNRLGGDYAFMFLMTMTPNFAAADYYIENESNIDINISLGRIPITFDMMRFDQSLLKLEAEFAYYSTIADFPIYPDPGEYVKAEWDAIGLGLGLLYDYRITENILIRPNVRYAYGQLANEARYHGSQTRHIADQLDETHLFSWETSVGLLNIGLGSTYFFNVFENTSDFRIDINRMYIDSFGEDNEDVGFSEQANMLVLRTDLVFPTGLEISGEDLNLILLLGSNMFTGENRNTLGYTESYQAGLATWIPIVVNNKKLLSIYLGAQTFWAENMNGFALLLNFSLD